MTESAAVEDRKRVNVYVSPEAFAMLVELGRVLRPARKRPQGDIVDQALREMYEHHLSKRGEHERGRA